MAADDHGTSPGSSVARPAGRWTRRGWARPSGPVIAAGLALGLGLGAVACTDDDGGDSSPAEPTTAPGSPAPGSPTPSPSTRAPAPPTAVTARIALRPAVDGLDQPTAMAPRPGTDELWLTEQGGTVRRVVREASRGAGDRSPSAGPHRLDPAPVLDVAGLTRAGGERGLLGIAFNAEGDELYLHHTAPEGDVVVAAYPIGADGTVDPATRQVLLTVEHRRFANHNGGQLALGPDDLLYIGVGDGGGAGDPDDRAQDTDQLLGKVLRIDPSRPSGDRPYAIPADNPFASGGGAPEIYLFGVRNPWRFSFDRTTDDLWVADVGQNEIEEVTRLPASDGAGRAANLGWPWFEGDQRFRTGGTPPDGLVGPTHTYGHSGANCSVTGGFVYRGTAVPALEGVYLYGDYCGGEVRGLLVGDGRVLDDQPLGPSLAAEGLVSFGQDADGELYVLTGDGSLLVVEEG